jgi:LPXTG-motif cell wall-anchored protein
LIKPVAGSVSGSPATTPSGDDKQASSSSDSGGDSNIGLWVAIGAGIIIIVGGGIFLARRRQTADERE